MPRLLFVLLLAVSATACRDLTPSSTSSAANPDEIAAELLATCATLTGEYAPFVDDRELDDFSTQHQLQLFRRLTKENVRLRSDAAMRLLAHSECRSEGVLYASMRVSTLEGDYRTLIDLQEIVSERGIVEECPVHDMPHDGNGSGHNDDRGGADDENGVEPVVQGYVPYALELRVAAAAGIGRILEADLPHPPGEGNAYGHILGSRHGQWHDNGEGDGHWDHGHHGRPDDDEIPPLDLGVTAEMASQSIKALQIASCPGNPREVRSAAIEALGLARDYAARDFLELIFAEAVEPTDQGANLFLRNMSGRSLTSITGNNHLADSDVDEILRLFLDAWNEQGGAP